MLVQNIKTNFTLKSYKCKYIMLIFSEYPNQEVYHIIYACVIFLLFLASNIILLCLLNHVIVDITYSFSLKK
jgi:hypothetical protein